LRKAGCQKADVGGQISEGREQISEGREQISEDRWQRTDVSPAAGLKSGQFNRIKNLTA
jgi:hypothetical protein